MRAPARRRRAVSAALAAGVLMISLAGCGGEEPHPGPGPSTASASASLGPGVYQASLPYGASVRITVPATSVPDERVDGVRKAAGVRRAVYATVEIDNSEGQRPVSVSRLVLTAADGARYQFDALSRAAASWVPAKDEHGTYRDAHGRSMDPGDAQEVGRRAEDLARAYSYDVPVGQRAHDILVGDMDEVPEEFARFELHPSIGSEDLDPVEPSPESDSSGTVAPPRRNAPGPDRGTDRAPSAPRVPQHPTRNPEEEAPRAPTEAPPAPVDPVPEATPPTPEEDTGAGPGTPPPVEENPEAGLPAPAPTEVTVAPATD